MKQALIDVRDLSADELQRLGENIPETPTSYLQRLRFPLLCGRDVHRMREQIEAELAVRFDSDERRNIFAPERSCV